MAIELDPAFASALERTFARTERVLVVHGDVMDVPLPSVPWRAFGNIPFARTTDILRRLLDDPERGPDRADLLIQYEAARKRASVERSSMLSLGWQPWWELAVTRRIARLAFDPPPGVDAGLLVVTRRPRALLDAKNRPAYLALLRTAFDRGGSPVRRSLRGELSPMTWKRLARDRGLPVDALPTQLDVWAWVDASRSAVSPVPSRPREEGPLTSPGEE